MAGILFLLVNSNILCAAILLHVEQIYYYTSHFFGREY